MATVQVPAGPGDEEGQCKVGSEGGAGREEDLVTWGAAGGGRGTWAGPWSERRHRVLPKARQACAAGTGWRWGQEGVGGLQPEGLGWKLRDRLHPLLFQVICHNCICSVFSVTYRNREVRWSEASALEISSKGQDSRGRRTPHPRETTQINPEAPESV